MKIPFGEYSPDQPALDNPGAPLIHNVLPETGGWYSPMRKPLPVSDALVAKPLGFTVHRDQSSVTHIYAGTSLKIYRLVGTAWSDISKAGDYSTADGDLWEFATFDDSLIATNYTDPIQSATHGNTLGDMAATAPRAKHIAVIGRFLFTGYCSDSDGINPNRVRWGPIDNPFGDWTPDLIDQDDFRDLRVGGAVQRLFGGEYGIVLQESAIQRISFVGGSTVHRFDPFAVSMGTTAPASAWKHEDMLFFYGTGGFHVVKGASIQNIGDGKVNRTVKRILDEDRMSDFSVVADPLRDLLYWYVPTITGAPDQILAYNWNINQFTQGDADDIERFGLMATSGTSIDDLDTLFGVGLDEEPLASLSLDSSLFKGSNAQIGVFDADYKLSTLEGDVRQALLMTAESQLIESRRSFLTGFRILVDGTTDVDGRIGFRDDQGVADISWTAYVAPNEETHLVEHFVDAVYVRAQVRIKSNFDKAIGIDVPSKAVTPSGYAG